MAPAGEGRLLCEKERERCYVGFLTCERLDCADEEHVVGAPLQKSSDSNLRIWSIALSLEHTFEIRITFFNR